MVQITKKNLKANTVTPPSTDHPASAFSNVLAMVQENPDAFINKAPVKPTEWSSVIVGDSGSDEALSRIHLDADITKISKALKLLKEALSALRKGNWKKGEQLARKAIAIEESIAEAWHILAISQEKTNQLQAAFDSYEKALSFKPHNIPVANDLGRLAHQLDQLGIAEKLYGYILRHEPDHIEAANNLATIYRDISRYEDAIEILRSAIHYNPHSAMLWNALGTILTAQGDDHNAQIFYREAINHDPDMALALYNLGNLLADQGDEVQSFDLFQRGLKLASDAEMRNICQMSLAFAYARKKDLTEAWKYYEGRLDTGTPAEMFHLINRPEWKPETEVKGKHIFVCAEQGLGDEVLFASILPDLIRDIGPEGKLSLAVEARLVSLFTRSFPDATVMAHLSFSHEGKRMRGFPALETPETIDFWTRMGELLKVYRPSVEAFPSENIFLMPDPERVKYWQAQLAALGPEPKVGLLWKSLIKHSQRDRHYSPFETWKTVLATPGHIFVNLQYGDVSEELSAAEAAGLRIWNPPGINLMNDLDDLCALCCAMDLIIGPPNATSNLAAGAGAKVWIISAANSWIRLGSDHYPWYPTVRAFKYNDYNWAKVMAEISAALTAEYTSPAA